MQKIALIISVIALGLGGFALYSSSNGASPEQDLSPLEEARQEAEQENDGVFKVAFIRGDSLNLKYNFILDKQDELISQTRQSEGKLQRKMAKAEQEYGELVQYIQSGQATEEEMQIAQQRMMTLEYELQEIQQKEQERIMKKEQAFQIEMVERLDDFLKKFASENQIDLILNKGISGEGVLYGTDPYDITDDVINQLNAEYALEIANENAE